MQKWNPIKIKYSQRKPRIVPYNVYKWRMRDWTKTLTEERKIHFEEKNSSKKVKKNERNKEVEKRNRKYSVEEPLKNEIDTGAPKTTTIITKPTKENEKNTELYNTDENINKYK